MPQQNYSLSELTGFIEKVLKVNFQEVIWIRGEISELREKSGHCYLELIEKEKDADTLKARARANIWSGSYRMLKAYFEESTGQTLHTGLSVLVAVTVEFHSLYGISLNIKDIDPSYTLGELAGRRLQIIRQLEKDGVMEINKSLELSLIPRRIAIISSATAAGYEDFMNQLQNHPSGYVFYTRLFPSVMQGEQAGSSIINSLEAIYASGDLFDAVVLIRGGGATTDMACFDDYELALNCAQFPVPIIAGIGHQRDLSIVDMVAFQSVKTPTAAAAFLIDRLIRAEQQALELTNSIFASAQLVLTESQQTLNDYRWKIRAALTNKSRDKHIELEKYKMRLQNGIQTLITFHTGKLDKTTDAIDRHNPVSMLKYGYTITAQQGKRISSIHQLRSQLPLTTIFPDGKVESILSGKNSEL